MSAPVARAVSKASPTGLATAVFLLAVALGWGPMGVSEVGWSASASAALKPTADLDGVDPGLQNWVIDLLSRDMILPTYAAIVDQPRFRREAAAELGLSIEGAEAASLRVTSSTRAAVITVVARGQEPGLAEALALGTLEQGERYIRSLDRLYVLTAPVVAPGGGRARCGGSRRVRCYGFSRSAQGWGRWRSPG